MTFYLNEIELETFELTPNIKYYPAVSIHAFEGYEFKLFDISH